MEHLEDRVRTLFMSGLHCSQVMVLLSHEMRNMSNPEFISGLGGLGGGLFRQKTCGTLTGGCCLLASFGAKSAPGEEDAMDYKEMVVELVDWFEAEFGSAVCGELVENDREKRLGYCPGLLAKTFIRCMEILVEHGIDPNG